MKTIHSYLIFVTAFAIGLLVHTASAVPATGTAPSGTARAEELASPWVNLRDAAKLSRVQGTESGRPIALASADFDEDGVPDLVTSYAGAQGNHLSVRRGNVDAIYPNSADAQMRRQRGEFTDAAFLEEAKKFALPEAVDLIGAGDFDADGHWDIVAARTGGDKLFWLRGDGHGNFSKAEVIELHGTVTALVTGEMNRVDGLTDLAIGVVASDGPAVLVFEGPEGALRGTPESFKLSAPASALALGQLDGDLMGCLAIASGNEVTIVHGRDRKLSLDEDHRADVKAAQLSRTVLPSIIKSLAIGDFAGDSRSDIAVLTADGKVRVLERRSDKPGSGGGNRAFQASDAMTLDVAENLASTPSAMRLLAAKVSSLPKDDLVIFGGSNDARIVITREADLFDKSGKVTKAGSARMSVAASLPSQSEVTAILPMRLNGDALKDLVLLNRNSDVQLVMLTQPAAIYVVNIEGNTNDMNPGDGMCADIDGNCSFNAALQEANAHPGADTINFNIPGGGIHTLSHGFQQYFNEAVTIDGTTQPSGKIEIATNGDYPVVFFGGNSVLRGVATYGSLVAIVLASNDNIVEGNYVGFRADGTMPIGFGTGGSGVTFRGGVSGSLRGDNNFIGGTTAQARNVISNCALALNLADSVGNVFRGNYIGTNAAGTAAFANAIALTSSGGDLTFGGTTSGAGNLISGNGSTAALLIQSSAAIIQGNLIGTRADGSQPISNSGIGISVSSNEMVTIGGTTPAARNVIAANSIGIVIVQDEGGSKLVQGNFIGTNVAGVGPLPNLSHGIQLRGSLSALQVTIGGTATGAGNLISGNGEDGISVAGGVNGIPSRAVIQGNLIGTDVNGAVAIPNMGNGIQLPSSDGTIIGGTTPEARNIISGNHANGIRLGFGTASSQIKGNYIGLNRFGTGALGNNGAGMFFDNFTGLGNTVGGTASGSSNHIAFNGGAGVATANGYLLITAVVANSIHDNAGLGIDLYNNGVTQNTAGSNSNHPIITSAETTNNTTTILGTLQNGNYTAGITYTLQFFSNANLDPSGYGEGQTYIGQTTIVTNGTTLPRPFSLTVTPAVPPGRFITAVASGKDQFNQEGYEYLSEFSFAARTRGEATPENTPLLIHLATPNTGGNTGAVTITIIGEGIQQGATVILRRVGQPDIIGTVVFVSADGSTITVRFDLAGHLIGAWDLVVTNPGGTPSTIPGGFTVEPGRDPQVWADIIGPTIMRVGSSHLFYITYGNTANIDAPPTEFRMTLPRGLLSIPVLPQSLGGSPAVTIDDGDLITLEFFVRDVPIGSSNAIPVRLIARQAQENFKFELTALTSTELEAAANAPIDPTASASLQVTEDTANSVQMVMNVTRAAGSLDLPFHLTRSETTVPQEPSITITGDNGILSITYEATFPRPHLDGPSTQDVINIVAQVPGTINANGTVNPNYVNTVNGLVSTANAAGNMTVQNSINDYLFTHNVVDPQTPPGITLQNTATAPVVLNAVSTLAGAPGSPVNAVTAGQLQALTGVVDGAWSIQLWQLYRTDPDVRFRLNDLLEYDGTTLTAQQLVTLLTKKVLQTKNIQPTAEPRAARQSRDPNDKFGPQGPGAPRFIRGTAPMNYLILFENQPSATAAAQDVVVTDQLDVTKFNLDTFELGPINFGNDVLVTPPPGRKEWNTDIDLRPENNLVVRVIAALDTTTGIVTWRFFSLDPTTLQPTEDALAGFLPPNQNSPEGEGGVMFKVELRPGLADGTEIRNRARIVFDTNAPIDTPEFLNTIDNSPPSSAVQSLPATNSSPHFEVSWSGADAGAGITGYTIYVSVDGGAYTVWLTNTTLTSAFYNGIPGRTYSFYSVALDAAGNLEAPPGPADATTTTPAAGDLFNISTRMRVQTGENVIIGGLIITGTDPKNVIIRGIGPSLAEFFPGALANPTLELYQGSMLLASNDDWKDTQQAEIEATGIPPTDDLESAIVRTLQPGSYTTILRGKDDTIGIGVVEAYDLNPAANSKLANISTRGFVETGDDVMIGGCILGGSGSAGANSRVVVRAIGPSLSAFGIAGALQDPTLELKDANGSTLISNDNWQQSQAIEINATGLAPVDFRESAVITYLSDGNYTAIVRGKDNSTGVALVEVYNLQ